MSVQVFDRSTVTAKDARAVKKSDSYEIYLIREGVAYGLNPVGKRIWELIQQPVQVGAVRDILLQEYDVDPERCSEDLISLLTDLVNNGLAELENAPVS